MQIDGFPTILGLVGGITFFAYVIIGYVYLRRIEQKKGHLYKVEDRETDWKQLIKDRNFQKLIGVIAILGIACYVTIQLLFILSPFFPEIAVPISTIGLHFGEEYAALFGGVLLVFVILYVWRKRREA